MHCNGVPCPLKGLEMASPVEFAVPAIPGVRFGVEIVEPAGYGGATKSSRKLEELRERDCKVYWEHVVAAGTLSF